MHWLHPDQQGEVRQYQLPSLGCHPDSNIWVAWKRVDRKLDHRLSDPGPSAAPGDGPGSSDQEEPGEPDRSPETAPSADPPQLTPSLRVGLLCRDSERARLEAELQTLPGLQFSGPFTDQPHVLLCAAFSVFEVVALLETLAPQHPHTVLLDLALTIGPTVAALHGFLGYLTRESLPVRHLACLWRVARGLPGAPERYELSFLQGIQRGPLDEEQQAILRIVASDHTQDQQARLLHLSVGTLKRRISQLKLKLGLGRHQSLAAAAVELGFARLWPISSETLP